jgi:hypothetical protein
VPIVKKIPNDNKVDAGYSLHAIEDDCKIKEFSKPTLSSEIS